MSSDQPTESGNDAAAVPSNRSCIVRGRADVVCVALLLGLSMLLWLPRLSGPIDLRWDAGVYYVLGTSLAEGRGYRLINEPGEPVGVQYPPALPAWVAAHQLLMGTTDPVVVGRVLRWTNCLISIAYTVLVFVFARGWLRPWLALLAAVLTALYFSSYFLSDMLFTEVPFAVVSLLFFLTLRQKPAVRWGFATTLLAWTAFLMRTAGIALLAAWVGDSLLRRRWKQAAVRGVLAAVPFLAWQGHVMSVERSAGYQQPAYEYQRAPYQFYNVSYATNARLIDPFEPELGAATNAQLIRRVGTNLLYMPIGLGEAVSGSMQVWTMTLDGAYMKYGLPVPPDWTVYLPLTMLFVLLMVGVGVAVRGRRWAVLLYAAFSTALICMTPWPGQFARYFAPATPVLVVLMMVGVGAAWRWLGQLAPVSLRRVGRCAVVLCLTSVLVMQVVTGLMFFRYHFSPVKTVYNGHNISTTRFYYGDEWRAFDTAAVWFAEHGEPEALVAAVVPHEWFLRLGNKAIMPPYIDDPAEAQRLLEQAGVGYLVIDTFDFVDVGQRYARPVIESYPERWDLVYASAGGELLIYRNVSTPDPAGGTP